MQHHVPFWRRVLVATDPGRLRLINACTVAIAVLISTVIAWLLVTFAHADHALLAMGAFLALQMGLVVKDPVARDRMVTTALLAVPIVTGLCVATLLARWHWLEIVVFVGVGGTATWLRRFGPRAWAMGAMAFFAYFFALFLRPSLDQLPEFCLVAVCAVGSVLLVRLATARPHPQRRIAVLLAELRGAGSGALAAAIATAPGDDLSKTLHTRLARVDTVSRSINAWQTQFSTGHVIDCDATTFATRVLDARIDTDHACLEIAERLRDGDPDLTRLVAEPVADLGSVLASRTPPDAVRATAERAAARLSSRRSATPALAAAAITDRAVIAQARLREVDLQHPLPEPERPADPGPAPGPATPGTPVPPWWQPWKRWATTTRMAVQVMVATGLATLVGEAISADRWYWAVLTAFIVFVGTTTRGAILTRASHRVLGTFAGVTVGFALTLLLDGNLPGLIAMCVGAVFCTLYFGPLLYAVQAFFMTVVLTAMYGLLGVLDRHILELRLAETVAGAAIGVICAYLVFSTSSRPALRAGVNHYFDVLDALLEDIRAALTGTGAGRQLLDGVRRLDTANADVSGTLEAMSISLLAGRRTLYARLEHLMGASTRYADRLAKIAISATAQPATDSPDAAALASRFDAAVDHVLSSAALARAAVCDGAREPVQVNETVVLGLFADSPSDPRSPQAGAVIMLSRLNWVLLRAAQVRRDA